MSFCDGLFALLVGFALVAATPSGVVGTTVPGRALLEWQHTLGGPDRDEVHDLRIAADGGLVLAGTTASFRTGVTDSPYDVLVAKVDSSGAPQWARVWGQAGEDQGYFAQVAPGGDVFVGGTTYTLASTFDALVMRFTADGTLRWARSFGTPSSQLAYDGVLGPMGDLYLAGYSSFGTDTFGGFVARASPTGQLLWVRHIRNASAYRVALDGAGGPVIAGETVRGAGHLTAFDPNGTFLWSREFRASSIQGLAPDGSGGFVVVGTWWNVSDNNNDLLVARFDQNHDVTWYRTAVNAGDDGAYRIVPDGNRNFLVAGWAWTSLGDWQDLLVASLSADGELRWGAKWGGFSPDLGRAVQTVAPGRLVAAGVTSHFPGEVRSAPLIFQAGSADAMPLTLDLLSLTFEVANLAAAARNVSLTQDSPASDDVILLGLRQAFSPVAAFDGPTIVDAGAPVRFDGSGSQDPDNDIATFSWEFGDGTRGDGATVQHTYAAPGEFTVTLTVVDATGLTNSTSRTIQVRSSSPVFGISTELLIAGGAATAVALVVGLYVLRRRKAR